jgi:hypothetical protein
MWRLEARGCNVAEPNEIVLENLREVATIEHHAAGAIDQPPPIGKAPDSLGCPAVPVDGTLVADYSTEPDLLGLISIHCFFLELCWSVGSVT